MISAPLVTFVVPCYNYAHLLGKCVSSILAQDCENFEVLIMDNCSPDNTPEVAQSFQDSRVRHIRNDSNLGAEQNFNKGLTLARGKYVWILSADDLLRSPSVLRRCVEVMEQNANLGFVFCRAIELDGEKERGIIRWANCGDGDCTWNDSTFVLRLLESNCIPFSCVLMRRECLNRVGMFPIDLPFAADWYLWTMLAMRYPVSYLAEPMVISRVHQDSLTTQQSQEYAHICVGDELTTLWRLRHQAEFACNAYLRDACHAALVRRAKDYLKAGLTGADRRINATEFEEILISRIQDVNGLREIRTAVYQRLADEMEFDYYADKKFIEPADEIDAFWDLCRHAEIADVPTLCGGCKLALAHRLACRLRTGALGMDLDVRESEFAEILQSRIPDQESVRDIRALLYRDLADQQFSGGEYTKATMSYRRALQARPCHPSTSAKYMLMRIGTLGIWIRHLSHQMREASRRN